MKRFALKYLIDLLLWTLATPIAYVIRLEGDWPSHLDQMVTVAMAGMILKGLVLIGLQLYRSSWHKLGIHDLITLGAGICFVGAITTVLSFLHVYPFVMPRSVPTIGAMLAIILMGSARVVARLYYEHTGVLRARRTGDYRRVLVVGAGEAGTMIAREMLRHPSTGRNPIGFIDDDPLKWRQRFMGLRVLGGLDNLPAIVRRYSVDEVLIAMPSAPGETVRRVVQLARLARVPSRTIPGVWDLVTGEISVAQIREVDVEDLLRRDPVRLDLSNIDHLIHGRVVMVTGAGGSIGSEIVRQVVQFRPSDVVLVGRGENSIFQIDRELAQTHPRIKRHLVITDVRDRISLESTFERHRPNIVFHAAAHKHVPLMEANPEQAVLNNVCGTRNLAELCLEYDVDRLVNISTDKAVNPTSVMGASKRIAEMVVYSLSKRCKPGKAFVSVRFGNVLGSRGSVIPTFKDQIKQGGPITITHPDMVRYFMTIPEASQLVLQAGSMAENGNVYVLDMGDPVRIVDLARDLIELSGLHPDDIEIRFTGMRPGEKLFEEILTAEEGTMASRHEKIFVAHKNGVSRSFDETLDELVTAAADCDGDQVRLLLRKLIPSNKFAPPTSSSSGESVLLSA